MSIPTAESPRFTLVVPVKTLSRAKSRLTGFPADVRRDLVRAFAVDALSAALSCTLVEAVVVVTDENDLADHAQSLGCRVLPDLGDGDLNAALRAAVRQVEAGPVAAMLGDLPCLLPDDLATALREITASTTGHGFVGDAAGTGTTLLAVRAAPDFDPRFGPGSRAAHLASGAREVTATVPTLRHDVDTLADLDAARSLGLGAHTSAVLERPEPRT